MESSVTIPGRPEKLKFFRQPDYTGNLQVYFEKWGFTARIGYHWEDDALLTLGGAADGSGDEYQAKRRTVDFKTEYRINDRWRIYGEVQNLTNAPARQWQGSPDRIGHNGNQVYGVTYLAGTDWNF